MVDWNDIETVLLDMDGTLLDLHFDNFFWLEHLPRRYAEIFDRQQEEARLELLERFRAEQGNLNWYCVDYWSRELGLDVPALKVQLAELEAEASVPNLWDDQENAQAVTSKLSFVQGEIRKDNGGVDIEVGKPKP